VIGILGGTFDPVHAGHIALAKELLEHLHLQQMRLLPCKNPVHRDTPMASAEDRLAMLKLATAGTDLIIDCRELERPGPSYTIDSLRSLRDEVGPRQGLAFCMGADAFATLTSWHQWRHFLELSHLVVMARPDSKMDLVPELESLLAEKQVIDPTRLHQQAEGLIYLAYLSQIPLSSTRVRQTLISGNIAKNALAPTVRHYIEERGLYRPS
jgi:nicotinate-nucleotide adenylyltransferase